MGNDDSESTIDLSQTFSFDFLSDSEDVEAANHSNQSNRTDVMRKYLVYMELPKIRIGDYRKSSCVSGNVIRFHFLLRIARDEANTVLRLLPIKAYKAPVVNFAVIHRPFLDDDSAKGPIPKSPDVRSPLINYDDEEASPGVPDSRTDDIVEDFRSDQAQASSVDDQRPPNQTSVDKVQQQPTESPKRRPSQTSVDKVKQVEAESSQEPSSASKTPIQPSESPKRRSSQASIDAQQRFEVEAPQRRPSVTSLDKTKEAAVAKRRPSQSSTDDNRQGFEVEAPVRRPSEASEDIVQQAGAPRQRQSQTNVDKPPEPETPQQPRLEVESPTSRQDISPARLLSDDNTTARTDTTGRQKQRRPKKYFVYCEIPKVLVGDYRNSSVICSEIIHAHFLMKIAKDEDKNQPRLKPIKRYHRPKVNFAVIHRSLLVDDEAVGPIPRSPNVRSPMICEDEPEDEEDGPPENVLHATMGFCYGRLPRSKYELVTQWSLVAGDGGGQPLPELMLSKADV